MDTYTLFDKNSSAILSVASTIPEHEDAGIFFSVWDKALTKIKELAETQKWRDQ